MSSPEPAEASQPEQSLPVAVIAPSEENIQLIFGDFKDAIKRGDEEKVEELLREYKEYDLANKIDPISK